MQFIREITATLNGTSKIYSFFMRLYQNCLHPTLWTYKRKVDVDNTKKMKLKENLVRCHPPSCSNT